ncbi:hypothetical protein A2232_03935 [candidate division WOR-1 bacterium RIFOXYA2_FULL_46_56]|uniref:Com family DNA-binding transcriptional regulator n=1 Tax=candidate division WOR-1 bacterium RIFOXYC2_FULL_46_14 TaxID=1802587 RepID=A0A1F4U4C0_UNCSA|nr:MAG: hypothetical protein A2232_03935 [candidate division WOR-1 bacterium RIFOXYA2_FULL_46_56]OGC39818.1 MAG: hypothetical protein A2438_04770 [candidate division WOR-1 bacterium RIFOXYC2_FULL_46_14]
MCYNITAMLQEFRCRCCNRMLAKIEECRIIEIKCPKCKTINLYRDNEIVLVQVGESYKPIETTTHTGPIQ